jgi:RsiW-degrading membrane proteinase PrsW (M82 family)
MSAPESTDYMHTVECPRCGDTVPAGVFCGACGTHLAIHHERPNKHLRSHAYAAAPSEHVLRVAVVSSLFPHLPHRSRTPFRVALVVLVAALVVLAIFRLQAPMIAVAAIGVPLLFMLYLTESDVYEDLPNPLLAVAVLLGAALGAGWALLTQDEVRTAVAGSLFGGPDQSDWWLSGVLIPVVGALVMLVPVAVIRYIRPPHLHESMDGFLLGSIGALGFTVAATITHLAPQLKTGVIAHHRPLDGIIVEALLQGGAVPLTAAGVGGVVGATLWVRKRDAVHAGRWLTAPWLVVPAVLVLYLVLGLIDVWQPRQIVLLGLHILGAVVALLVLRYGVHAVLLHEEHEVVIGPPRVCPHCEQVVPSMPFCPHCGYAMRASSRAHRANWQLRDLEETSS